MPSIWDDFDAGAKPPSIWGDFDKTKATDYVKSAASGALSGTGMIAQGGGELLARGINAVAGTELRSVNPLKGAIDWLEESKSPGAKQAEAATQISGSLFDPDTWSFGADPSLKGLALQGLNAIGQFAPNLAIALTTAGASIPAQLTIGATVGGLQALGGGAEEERTKFERMTDDELKASSKLFNDLVGRGVDTQTARHAVAEAAALGGGMGNAIPSAAEGAFENFLIGAITRGKVKIPAMFGRGVAGKVATGVLGGGAMGGTEEAIEQMGQNIGSNIGVGGNRPITDDTLQQFVMGAIAEGVAGGGGAAAQHVLHPADDQRTAQAVRDIGSTTTVDEAIATATAAAAEPVHAESIVNDRMSATRAAAAPDLSSTIAAAEGTGAMANAFRRAAGMPEGQGPDWAGIILQRMESSGQAGVPPGFSGQTDEPVASDAQAAGQALPETGGAQTDEVVAPAPAAAVSPTVVDELAHEAAPSPQNELPEPTPAQKEAGNYRKGHVAVSGLDISVENPAGSKRRPEWPALEDHYGYVKGVPARAPDKEHVDVFVKPATPEDFAGQAYVVDQKKKDGSFDEPKVMIGFGSLDEARAGYLRNYSPGWDGIQQITPMTMAEFKAKLQDPAAFLKPQAAVTIMGKRPAEMTPRALEFASKNARTEAQRQGAAAALQIATPQPAAAQFGKKNTLFTEDKANRAREILRKKLGTLSANAPLDPELIQAGIDLAGYYIEGGARSFADFSAKMIGDLGEAAKPHLKSWYLAVRNYPGFDKQGMHSEADIEHQEQNAIARADVEKAHTGKYTETGAQIVRMPNGDEATIPHREPHEGTSIVVDTSKARAATTDVMQRAVGRIGEERFRKAVADHFEQMEDKELEPAERAAEIEGVARNVLEGAYDEPKKAAAPAQEGTRKNDDDGKPIYEKGERVEITGGPFKGRHGAISERHGVTTTVLGMSSRGYHAEGKGSTSYHYQVKTDNGADGFVYHGEFKPETEPNLVNTPEDIKIDGRYRTPEEVLRQVGYAKSSASNMRAKAARAVKASNKAEHARNAETEDKKAAQYQAAFDAWAERYPHEAAAIKGGEKKSAAPAPKATTTPASSSTPGMTLHESKHTKTGDKLWVVSLDKRVERDEYNALNAKAKGLGGYYSSYRGGGAIPGFTFKDEAQAREFMGGEQPAGAVDVDKLKAYAAKVVQDEPVLSVYLVGSAADGKANPADVDLLYVLRPIVDTAAELEDLVEAKMPNIDLGGEYDTFVSVGEKYFHLSSGAGRSWVENSDYAREQRGKPRVLLAKKGTEEQVSSAAAPAPGTPAAVAKALRDAAQTIEQATKPAAPTVEAKAAQADNGGSRERDLQADRDRGAKSEGARAVRQPEGERAAGELRGPEGGGSERVSGPRAVEANRPAQGVVTAGSPDQGAGPDGNRPSGEGAGPARARLPATGDDYRIQPDDLTYHGSWKSKAIANVEAIRIAKAIAQEGRAATPEEQKKLVKFVGWGASEIANGIFPDRYGRYKDGWQDLGEQLQAVLSEDELAAARRTTQYAHYTSRQVIQSIYGAVSRMGFASGRIIEPGMGVGHFTGLMPDTMARSSSYTGVEYDPIPALIAKALYPNQNIIQADYTKTELPDDFYDMAIGNPPFSGQVRVVNDPRYRKYNFALHDYFFAKTLDKVRPGGLVVFVTSAFTMDKASDRARQFMAERANLLGAIRLPQTAFVKNAGTEVVTDVLFLQKKGEGVQDYGQPWRETVDVPAKEGTATVNEYFRDHPEMVLGEHAMTGTMYREGTYTVEPREGENIEDAFRLAADKLPQQVYQPVKGSKEERAKVDLTDYSPTVQKEGNYYIKDGQVFQRSMGIGQPAELSGPAEKVIRDFIGLRDALKQAHYDQLTDGPWEASLKSLQKAYRGFVAKHGRVNQFKTYERLDKEGKKHEWRRYPLHNIIDDDADWTLVAALETENEETHKIHDSQFLSERVLNKPAPPKIETVQDAMYVQLDQDGTLDLDKIAELAKTTKSQAVEVLGDAIFETPQGEWQTADEYLSGNVGLKLKEARAAAASDRRFARNLPALEKAIPKPVPPSEISARLGAPFIEPKHIEQFFKEKLGLGVSIEFNPGPNLWSVIPTRGQSTVVADSEWGTDKRDAFDLLRSALNKHQIRVTFKDGEGKTHFDATATAAANDKLKKIQDAFSGWIWTDGDRAAALAETYNERFNNIATRQFDGTHLTLPGLSSKIRLRPHQKRVVWRIIQRGNTYIAHAVGAGKTLEMVVAGMEMRRLGMVKKPQYVVPNHMLQQFAREFMQAYPTAKLLVADEKEFHSDNRRRFVAKAALSDLDAIIITQSAFKMIDTKPEFKGKLIQGMIDEIDAIIDGLDKGQDRVTLKQLERNKETLEKRLEGDLSGANRDKNIFFEDMGVDFLFVDEAHLYRKLPFVTNQGNIKGIDPNGSQYALDLYVKTRWLEEQTPGRNLVMASGTPITNTVGELYTVQRYIAEKVLEERGLRAFDAWASMFGAERTGLEQNAAGHYAPVTRFASFINVPELSQMFRDIADVIVGRDLGDLVPRPKLKTGARQMTIAPSTPIVKNFQAGLAARMKAIEMRKGPPKPGDDILLSVINDGRLLAIDPRFVIPGAQQFEESKLNKMLDKVVETHKATADYEYRDEAGNVEPQKGASQVVFSDLGFGEQVAANRGFDARAWLMKRLVAGGLLPQQIAFMSDYHKSADKLKLFQAVNAGRVRVVVGSSKNMGVGTNMQKRLYALHHLDAPWYPADMEQREGRILRQGNKNPEVEMFTYATKGTYDSTMFQMNATKSRFIEQLMTGDATLRTMEDVSEASQYEMAQAISSGDERVIKLAGMKAELEGLNRLFAGFLDDQQALRRRVQNDEWQSENARKRIPNLQKDLDAALPYFETHKLDATIAGKHYDKPGEAGEALLAALKERAEHVKEGKEVLGSIAGFPVEFDGVMERDKSGSPKAYEGYVSLVMASGDTVLVRSNDLHNASAVGAVMRATNHIQSLARTLSDAERALKQSEEDAKSARSRMGGQFEYLQKMQDVTKEITAIEDALKAESAAAMAQTVEAPPPANEGETIPGDTPALPESPEDAQFSRPRVVHATDERGAPLLSLGKFQLVEPQRLHSDFNFEGARPWQYKIAAGERVIGVATLAWKDGKVRDLMYIRTLERYRGLGIAEDVVHGILSFNDGTPLRALSILPKARGFWEKMGTEFVQDAHGDEDGILTLENYDKAKAARDAKKDGGPGPGAGPGQGAQPEGTQGPGDAGSEGRDEALKRVRAELVDAFGERGVTALEDSGFLELTTSADPRLAALNLAGADAVYWNGRAWFLADRIAPEQAAGRLLHELGEHHGLEEMLGEKAYGRILKNVEAMHKAGNAAVRDSWAHVKGAYPELEEGSAPFLQEVIGALTQDARVAKQSWWRDLLDAIKAWLVKMGLNVRNEEDVLTLLRAAVASSMRRAGEQAAGAPDLQPAFSRPAIAATATTGDFRDSIGAGAADFVRDMLRSDAKFNFWHRTIGTQQHKALINREFRGVYDESQAFLSDVSKYANEAADLATSLLPRIEGFADFGKKSPSKADVAAVTKALYAGTLYGGGSPTKGRKWHVEELKRGRSYDGRTGAWGQLPVFDPLTDAQIDLYQQTMASVGKSLDELGKSLIHRLARTHDIGFDRALSLEDAARTVRDEADELLAQLALRMAAARDQVNTEAIGKLEEAAAGLRELKKSVDDIEKKTTTLKDKGYFPAMRFGRFAVQVINAHPDGSVDQLHFSLHESQTAANLAARRVERDLKPEYPDLEIHRGIVSKEQYRLFQGMSLDSLETFADYITGENGQPIAKDPLVQGFLKAAIAERSALKRHIHRKGTAGFSDDLPRVLASFTVSSARAAATAYHMAEMLRRANDIRAGDVKDEAIKLVTYLRDPQEEAQGIRGFLFTQFLGGSIAHGLVNMTQPFMVTVPYLAQYTNAADAAARVAAAAGAKESNLTGALRDAYQRAKNEGVVAPQEIHQLRAETGGMPLGKSLTLRKLSFLWGSIYAITEQFNRSTSFIAAYRVAQDKGLADPYGFAKRAVEETQFVYNKGNRPNWARGPVGATVFTFKQFSISYLELAKRLYVKDKAAFALMALMLFAAAGLEGMPFAEDAEDIIDTIGQWMGFGTNSKKALRQWAERTLGKDIAPVVLHGISGLPFMPVDVSVRMGMQNLIPGTAMMKLSEKDKARDVLEFVGPIGQFVPTEDTQMGKALERLSKSDYFGAVKAGAPVAVQNIAKGSEMLSTGEARDAKGKKVTNVSPGEAVLKMAGLQPASVARESGRISEVAQDIALQRRQEDEIAEQWARAIVDGKTDQITAALKKLHDWNVDNPELRIKVTSEQIRSRVKAMRTAREDRMIKSAPPEIRATVREALRQ